MSSTNYFFPLKAAVKTYVFFSNESPLFLFYANIQHDVTTASITVRPSHRTNCHASRARGMDGANVDFAHLRCGFLYNLTSQCDHAATSVKRQCNQTTKAKVCSTASRFQHARLLQAVLSVMEMHILEHGK